MSGAENFFKLLVVIAACTFLFHFMILILPTEENDEISLEFQCGHYPSEKDILIDNVVWQILEMPKGFVKLLNAYLDMRRNQSIVRVNANGIHLNITTDTIYCQFWFEGDKRPKVVKSSEYFMMYYWGTQADQKLPYLIECPFNNDGKIPTEISLAANPCDTADNLLKIIDNQPENGVKKTFGVCSKFITYENRNFGIRFIEWVHILRILGNDKVYFYNRFVHDEVFKVFQYMEGQKLIEMWPFLEPAGIPNMQAYGTQHFLLEMNMLNDCFYRIRNLYEYVVVLDADEVIMPVLETDRNWMDILISFNKSINPASYCFENVYYPNTEAEPVAGVPNYHHMLQHIQRSENFSFPGQAVKSFNVPEDIKVIHNHYALFCFSNHHCWCYGMPTNISQLSHYRDHMDSESFLVTVESKLMWKYKDELIRDVKETIEATNFIP